MFTKDSRTENFLTQMGVTFGYTNNLTFQQLVPGWEKDNLARPVPVREEAVVEYASLMEAGSAAPAPILHRQETGKHAVLDGIQRLAAAQLLNSTKWSAYLVDCDSADLVAAIRVLSNVRLQGRAEPVEWTRRRAVEVLVLGRGLSVEEVARMGGWRPADINRLSGIVVWGNKIRNVSGPELPDSMLEMVARYLPESELYAAPEPIVQFLGAVKEARFSAADAEPYIQEFFAPITKPSRRHRLYEERFEKFMDQPEVSTRVHGRRAGPLPRDVVLLRELKSAESVLDEIIAERVSLPYIDEFFRLLGNLDRKLKSIAPNPKAATARVPADKWSKDAQTQKGNR